MAHFQASVSGSLLSQRMAHFLVDNHNSFENVLNRLTFYDKDSNPIIEQIDELKRKRYLNAIKADYNYFASSYERADFQMNIEHIKLEDIPYFIIEELRQQNIMPLTTLHHSQA